MHTAHPPVHPGVPPACAAQHKLLFGCERAHLLASSSADLSLLPLRFCSQSPCMLLSR